MRKGEEPREIKGSTGTRTSWYEVATDVLEVGGVGRFLHHYSSQVWNGVPVSHRNKNTARWCLTVLIKEVIKQFVCSKCHTIAFLVLPLCEKVRYKL